MGKSMNLNNLSPEEAQQILQVIQKDFELREKERVRLGKIEEVINEEENKTELLSKQQHFNENCCIRCCQTFGFIFNRKQTCLLCRLYVCKSCAVYDDNVKGYHCKACLQERELKHKSLDWFYNNVSKKYKRFGSAKVVRTLYKHSDGSRSNKFHWSDGDEALMEEDENLEQADNESDSGYDPSLYSSFGQSGSARVKTRPSLSAIFPEITVHDETGQELDNSLFPAPPTLGLAPLSPNGNLSHHGELYHDNHNESLDTSFEDTRTPPTPTPRTTVTTPTLTQTDLDNKEQDKRDIYKEAFDQTKKTEETKFKVRFDNLLGDMQQTFDNLSPRDGRPQPGYGSTSYGDMMTTYRARVKDLLISLSQRLELAVESFDETCAHNPGLTSQKVRLMISKLIEDRLGESLDLTSDEAVSDLSSLSDDSGELKSFEDQIAQAVIARVLELHRNVTGVHLSLDEPLEQRVSDSSEGEAEMVVGTGNSSMSEDRNVRNSSNGDTNVIDDIESEDSDPQNNNNNDKVIKSDQHSNLNSHNHKRLMSDSTTQYEDETDSSNQNISDITDSNTNTSEQDHDITETKSDTLENRVRLNSKSDESEKIDEAKILQDEFAKLRSFAKEAVPRPLYEEVNYEEVVEQEPVEESMEYTTVDHEESQEDFSSRFFTFDKVHDSDSRGMPDFSDLDYEYHDLGINEIDPDLLSMNLAIITEETEEELEDDKENETEYEQDWKGNWMFKGAGGIDSYTDLNKTKMTSGDFGASTNVMVPMPRGGYIPKIGNREVDDMSDMSENEDRDDDLDNLSDEENSFYAKTSEEIARITRKTSSNSAHNMSTHTEGESDAESVVSRPYSSSFSHSDYGVRSSRLDQNSFDSRTSEQSQVKLSEELVPSITGDPKFEIPPDSVTIAEGEPAKLTCRVAGTQPLDVFWYRVQDELEDLENSENYEIVKDGHRQHLTMYNMTRDHAGQYMCMVINEHGQCCQYFVLKVKKNTQELKSPEFLKGISDVEVTEGSSVKFRCKVKGYPQPRVVWYKDGQILTNQLNYRLERFGNRDYLLVIDSASMDEDAEYCCLAKNIAGEVRSTAQLIVEPSVKPESSPKTSKPKVTQKEKETKQKQERSSSPEFPSLSYLPKVCRSNNTSSAKKDEQNLSNLSKKVSMTKDSVTEVAEDMLSSSKELTEINQSIAAMDKLLEDLESDMYTCDDVDTGHGLIHRLEDESNYRAIDSYYGLHGAAENVRKVTSSALDYLNNTDVVMMRDKTSVGMATSTPRSSDTERVFNPDSDTSNSRIACDSDIAMETYDYTNDTLNTSEDSHKSEVLFNLNPMSMNTSTNNKDRTLKSNPEKSTLQSSKTSSASSDSKPTPTANVNENFESRTNGHMLSSDTSQTTYSPNNSYDSTDNNQNSADLSSGSERLKVNLGSKRENKEPYQRDFYITNTPMPERRGIPTSPRETGPTSPRIMPSSPGIAPSSPRETPASPGVAPVSPRETPEQQRAHTEEKIYLAAGNVYTLENKVQTLQDKMRALNAVQEQDRLAKLENQVAQTVAQVATSEKQVQDVEQSVKNITKAPQLVKLNTPTQSPSSKSRPAPAKPVQQPQSPPRPKPEPTFLKGDTSENDLPESRTEFNEEYADFQLPSVNRLKAMFGNSQQDKDSSIKRGTNDDVPQEPIHSITARSVPKEKLEKLRKISDDHPASRVAMPTSSEPVNPGRATSLTTGQQTKVTPNMPKQVYKSADFKESPQQLPKQSIQISSNVKNTNNEGSQTKSAQKTMKITLATGNTNRPMSPVQSVPSSQNSQPTKTHVTGKSQAPQPPSQSNTPTQGVKTGSEIDTPEGRRSPKIKSGAISAMSKFWEKVNVGAKEDSAPEILEYD